MAKQHVNKPLSVFSIFLLYALSLSGLSFAGGPRDVEGDGTYYRWNPNQPVKFTIDQEAQFDPSLAKLVRNAFQAWADISTAALTFSDEGFLSQDINVENYESYFGIGSDNPPILPENPIIIDSNGAITDDLFGSGASSSVLGFAGPRFFNVPNREIISAWAVLNQKLTNDDTFPRVIRHELGHLLGLDHAQGFQENADQVNSWGMAVPLMYPYMLSRGPDGPITDDIAWFSWMYPTENFAVETGTIKGRVLRRSGAAFQGANVVATPVFENSDGTFRRDRREVTSVVSDFLWQGTGEYELPGLRPGKYLVSIEPIRGQFTGSSGVGPFDVRPTNFPVDFYDQNESFEEDPTLKTVVEVVAGSVVTGIDIIANEVVNDLKSLGDDDEMLYEFPEGFHFPFYGKVYSSVVVNSDGNLTFGIGDGKVGDARTEERFLTGPPRIAPLFTDLDPSDLGGGEVTFESGEGFIKFTWNQVPEWAEEPPLKTNTFSVTLFSSGDILFEYDSVNITPDPSEFFPEGLHSIVGVTAGGQSGGVSLDLSAADLTMTAQSLYQVFPGNTFDLTGGQVRFIAVSSEYYFPVLTGDVTHFTGLAVTNFGETDDFALFENFSTDGTLKNASDGFPIPADQQLARLGFEIFDYQATDTRDGWIRMSSGQPQLAGFFQIGDAVNRLDGAVAVTDSSDVLYFTRLFHGQSVFPSLSGFKDAVTWIAIANPNDAAIDLAIRLYSPTANLLTTVEETLPPFGSLFRTVEELLGSDFIPLRDGFLKVEVDGPGAVGFELIELEGTVFGLNAATDHDAATIYSGQLGHGNGFFTNLNLVNPTDSFVHITLTAFIQGKDSIDERTSTLSLTPNQSFQKGVDELFGLPQLPADTIVGSIQVDSTAAGIIGDVVFGDPESVRFAAALPLQTRLFTRAIHSQVSNGFHSSNPGLDSFTGLALFNPGTEQNEVTIEVYDQDGKLVGDSAIVLGPRERISQILAILVPETVGLVRGSVLLISTRPLVAQELFGNADLHYLSAVPPTIIE